MVILEEPYVSEELKWYLEETQTPVLKNQMAKNVNRGVRLNLMEPAAFREALKTNKTSLYDIGKRAGMGMQKCDRQRNDGQHRSDERQSPLSQDALDDLP